MMLSGKIAMVFAATGAIASVVAETFAREGATVFLSGVHAEKLEAVANNIRKHGGTCFVDIVDAVDEAQVASYMDEVVARAGRIDIVFNGIGGRPADLKYPALADTLALADFMVPIHRIVGSQFVTSREAGRRMAANGGGAIVTLSATLSGGAFAYMTGISAACGAIEVMTNSLAGEWGQKGVRVNCVRGSAMPETRTIQETGAGQAALRGKPPEFGIPPLGRMITVAETAKAAAFLASDNSSGMTGQTITVCAGQFVDR